MSPMVEPSLTKPSTSSPVWKLPVIVTVAESSVGLMGSVTVMPASMTVAVCSSAEVAPADVVSTGASGSNS